MKIDRKKVTADEAVGMWASYMHTASSAWVLVMSI